MTLVGESEFTTFLSNHNPMQHHFMDWATGPEHGGHSLPRGMHHHHHHHHQSEDVSSSSYMTPIDPFSHSHSFSLSHLPTQNPFDLGDNYHTPKVEPMSGNSADFDYYHNPSSQVNSSQGSYQVSSVGAFMPQQQASNNAYGSQSPFQQQKQQQHGGGGSGGALEDIDNLIRNFPDVHQQHHADLEMDPLLFNEIVSLQQPQQRSIYGGHETSSLVPVGHVSGMSGGPVVSQQQHTRGQWIPSSMSVEDAHVLLARDLQEQILSENSLASSPSLSSEKSPVTFASSSEAAMSSFYPEVARSHPGMSPANWGASGSSNPSSSAHQQQQQHQMILKQQQNKGRVSPSGLGGYSHSQPDPSFILRSAAAASGFGPSSSCTPSPLSLHQLQSSRLPPNNAHLNHLAEQILPGNIVPATGLQLVHLMLACAEAVADNKLHDAEVILARLRSHVLPDGNPMQRLAAYFEQALTARLTKDSSSPIFKGLTGDRSIPPAEILEAFSVYYECIPIGKFGHLTCNQILLDAVEREKVIHVLDLHIWHGMQWPAFLQALALRPGGPPKLRISAVGSDASDLQETGEKLHECAKNLAVPFEFCPILTPLENFTSDMVETRRGEAIVVNSFVQFHGIRNKSPNCLNMLLGDLRRLNPRVMAFAENDGNHNSNSFLTRFVECLRYYSAVFDAFDASLPPDSPARMKMEQIFAAQKIRNIIACEGAARVDGHETMKYWHKRMEAAHFRCVPLSSRAVSQANLLLNLYYSNGYTLNTSDCGYLALGWHGMPLTGVSAWH